MDSIRYTGITVSFWLILMTVFSLSQAVAAPIDNSDPQSAGVKTTSATNQSPAIDKPPSPSETDELAIRFPKLERALIIATIVNFIIIIFGLAMYLGKRRMQQFSPAPLAQLKTGN
jgi:hypothetical protein